MPPRQSPSNGFVDDLAMAMILFAADAASDIGSVIIDTAPIPSAPQKRDGLEGQG